MKNRFYLLVVILIWTFLSIGPAHAFVVAPDVYDETIIISQPKASPTYYGELDGFPHTYELSVDEPIDLFMQVLVPDIEDANNNRSAIIVRKVDRGVEEISRMNYNRADWEPFYEKTVGESYRKGPIFEGELTKGEYIIEVSTPDNIGKYVLTVGKIEDFSNLNYFEKIVHIYEVKKFMDKAPVAMIVSPYIYLPLTILAIGYLIWRRKRKI